MKIALCYSGNLRTFEHCVKNHSTIFEKADVYVSTWDSISLSNTMNDDWHTKVNIEVPNIVDYNYIDNLIPANFTLRDVSIESYDNQSFTELQNYNHLWYQYYQIKKCFDMVGDNYDIIVRIRPDITIGKFHYDVDKITFNKNVWYNHEYKEGLTHINEMVWVSNYEFMEKSVKVFNNLVYLNETLSKDEFYGESIMYNSLKIEGLIKYLNFFDFEYKVIR